MHPTLEKISKFLNLEKDRSYDDRAVLGGLIRVLPIWENESKQSGFDSKLSENVADLLRKYHDLEADGRKSAITTLFQLLADIQASLHVTEESQSSAPAPKQSSDTQENIGKPATSAPPSTVPVQAAPPEQNPAVEKNQSKIGFNAPLTVLTGVGSASAKKLESLDLHNLGDLLHYYPRRYDDYSQLKTIAQLEFGDETTVIGIIQSIQTRQIRNRKMKITEAVISDSTGFLRLTWFNQPWLEKSLRPKMQVVLSGKVDMYLGRLVMSNPEWEQLDREQLNTNRIVPVYPLTAHITQKWLRKTTYKVVNYWAPRVEEYLPEQIKENEDLINLDEALRQIHFPDTLEALDAARERLAFDEIFMLQLGLFEQKKAWQAQSAASYQTDREWLDEQISQLPFPLTNAQRQSIEDIAVDIKSGHPMNRLLQGDVGAGKTIVAAMGIALITRHHKQAALMAPTSILAEQHYRSLLNYLANPNAENSLLKEDEIQLLVGDTSAKEKEAIRQGLENGTIKLVIGTHALIESPVIFKDLQMIIIDEQHRFGVEQRAKLREKGENPHLLVMTATPIPRTMALTVYGDLDLSVMDEMPAGRQEIKTHVVSPLERERVYRFIDNQINQGHQAFIIYPLVEQGKNEETKAAVDEQKRLQTKIFPDRKVGLMHGRLRPDEKDDVMEKFRNREYDILVSTSVVEVGVDVPNATVMTIEGANRFGLAQLHQFRGRVGRGDAQSFCFLIPETDDALENERLKVMASTNDGFVLAEHDLQQRGPGDFLGTRQSGFAELKIASLTDANLIEKARKQAEILFQIDPDLSNPEHQNLKETVSLFWTEKKGDIS